MMVLQAHPMQRILMFVFVMMILPGFTIAATEDQQAIEKLKQVRSAQNQQVKIENIKANALDVSHQDLKIPGFDFHQRLQERNLKQIPKLSQRRGPNFHRIDPDLAKIDGGTHTLGRVTTAITDSFSITVNGKDADTLLIGSEPFFSIYLGGSIEGELVIYWDRNHNGITDTADIPIEMYSFMDNDEHDLNPADNVFEFIYDNEMADGLNRLTDDLLFTVFAGDTLADAIVQFYADPTPWTVSGLVTDSLTGAPIDGIIVWGFYMWNETDSPPDENHGPTVIAVTDTLGQYVLTFPDSGHVVIGSWDHLMVTEGQLPVIQEVEVPLMAAVEGVDFLYRDPQSYIEGTVLDEYGVPIEDIRVRADIYIPDSIGHHDDDGGPSFEGFTDETGFYRIGVDYGDYQVELEPDALVPDYMVPQHQIVPVMPGPYPVVDFVVLIPNSTIEGTVWLDDVPYSEAWVVAWNEDIGMNAIKPVMDGSYSIPVYAPPVPESLDLSPFEGYNLHAQIDEDDFASPVEQISDNWGVMPGTTGEDIMLVTLSGGLAGTFFNNETGEPILETWDVGMEVRNMDSHMHYWTSPDPMDGSYTLWLPPGAYEVKAGGYNYYPTDVDTIHISDVLRSYNVFLDPVTFEGIFNGLILDDLTNMPIAGADIEIGSEHYWDMRTTGDDGSFHFNLPNGDYHYRVSAMGYLDDFGDVSIQDNQVNRDIKLQELVIEGAIMGYVVDGRPVMESDGMPVSPIAHASVNVWNPATHIGFHMMTDSSGGFWFDLPNGLYDIHVDHPDFLPYWESGLFVSNDTTEYILPLMPAEGYISGRVFDMEHGHPIWDAHIAVIDQDSLRMFDFYSGVDDSGRFRIPVVNGIFDVFVDAPGYQHKHIADVAVEFNEHWLDVPLMKRPHEGPMMHFVSDQPDDQGRWVRLMFGPEDDNFGKYMAYSIWRMTYTPFGAFYDFIAYVPNRYEPLYNLVAPTLVDSNAYTRPEQYTTEFMVTGHYDQWNFVDGGHGFGWSVDNINPSVPDGPTVTETGDGYTVLGWNHSQDTDFQFYKLFRNQTQDFTGLEPIAQLIETSYRDDAVTTGQEYFYMLKAVDANGNESEGAVTSSIVSVDGKQLPEAYSLSQNYPNPFNPTTQIEFALPEASDVLLEIYNIRGQKIRTLHTGHVPAGFYTSQWDGTNDMGLGVASGTYIYLMKAGNKTFTKKMVYMK